MARLRNCLLCLSISLLSTTLLGCPNTAPTANAGPDQTLTLATGDSTVMVTLDGTGSSDPDGNIASYTWNGNPNPDDVASPTVEVGEGVHYYRLHVTDNDGASSSSDTVIITVQPPPNLAPADRAEE